MSSFQRLNSGEGYKLLVDPLQEEINGLIASGQVEVIDRDILRLPRGVIEFRTGDQFGLVPNEEGQYERVWPSRIAYERETARELLGKGTRQ